jgi:hypothetical protein
MLMRGKRRWTRSQPGKDDANHRLCTKRHGIMIGTIDCPGALLAEPGVDRTVGLACGAGRGCERGYSRHFAEKKVRSTFPLSPMRHTNRFGDPVSFAVGVPARLM